jgi:hypothetical protein
MNYIPGFSNYLETSVPRYAIGGRVMDGERMMLDEPMMYDTRGYSELPYGGSMLPAPAAQPMTQEAAPFDPSTLDFSGLDLSGLNSLYGMNFGSNFGGGGAGGGIFQADPNIQYIGAPKSNKGNPTSKTGGNTFAVRVDQPVRLVDHRTNQVVFEGTGFDAARKATEMGQSLTNSLGRKANYSIQTADPSGEFKTVAYEKKNKSTLGAIADVALPVIGTIVAGPLGAAAGSAASSIAQGRSFENTLLRAGIAAGGSALGGQVFGPASSAAGSAAGSTAGSAAAGAAGAAAGTTAGSTLGSVAGDIVVNAARSVAPSLLGSAAGGALGQAALSEAGNAAARALSGYKTPAEQFAQQPTPVDDTIVVSANRLASGSGLPFGSAFSVPVNEMLSGALSQNRVVDGIDQETGEIVAEGRPEPLQLTQDTAGLGSALAGLPALGGLASDPNLVNYDEPYASDIVVTGNVPTVTQDPGLGSALAGLPAVLGALPSDPALAAEEAAKKKLGLEDYLSLGSKAVGLLGNLTGGGGSGQTGAYGGGRLNPIFSAKLPTAGGLGVNRTVRPMTDEDWLTYGTRPERSFFEYAPQTALPTPITTPIPNEPAGPSMYAPEVDNMRFAEGGRAEFAVNGPGTGRSDDIPAVLSDGEYVIDAETVALLGDGSSKAGAKKLDDLRVKVRKHKGQKLAKGRFSANAKKPEAYLSGGRI